jgi:hypothetical protein
MSQHDPPEPGHGDHVLGFAILQAIQAIDAPVRAWEALTAEEHQRWAAVAQAMMRAAEERKEDRACPVHTQMARDESSIPLPKIPIGIDDFRKLRERGLLYVDKSHLIREIIDREGIEVVL